MAGFSEHRKILKQIEKLKPELSKIVDLMGVEAKNHFTNSFREQGFTDETLSLWKPRKRSERGKSRAILVKSGRLRRSLRSSKRGSFSVVISTDVPYAQLHNDGGIINKRERTANIMYRELYTNLETGKTVKRFAKKKGKNKATHSMSVNIGAHTIKMPKRQFIGYSGKLNRKIISKFDQRIKKWFKA